MKKLLSLSFVGLCALTLAACGNGDSSKDTAKEENSAKVESKQENSAKTETKKEDKISDSEYETDHAKFVIKEVEQLTGKYDNKQILAITIEFTNKGDTPTSPWMAFATSIKATQETDVTVETLNGANGYYPDDYKPELVEMGGTNIKPGATVEAVVGFDIEFPGSPVQMLDFNLSGKPEKFDRVIETTAP
ncbi:DUF5067 domain-containing protein [Isobaculum melis]|uniref:DUF5067 domain-containing protein n=1 Tax=Isobaculum melis TaxID=142588 RepID=A0A1H9TYJ4_9LACT|nr:DUF5067 domain-containing protein [Isobaculum melis]SES02189.1 protein of unknown function [Isobaculum melis]